MWLAPLLALACSTTEPPPAAPAPPPAEAPSALTEPRQILLAAPGIREVEDFVPESWRDLPYRKTQHHDRGEYRACVQEMEALESTFLRIRYTSGELGVAGVVALPPGFDPSERYPLIVANYGNAQEGHRITACKLPALHRWAAEGYVVAASQYRGIAGSQGRDTFGGDDVQDVTGLLEAMRALPFIDDERAGMIGYSRGGMMTYLALKAGARVKAAVAACAPTDLALTARNDPEYGEFILSMAGGTAEAAFPPRSAVAWPEALHAPILIQHGDADTTVDVAHARLLARALERLGAEHRLTVYPGASHCLNGADGSFEEALAWLRARGV